MSDPNPSHEAQAENEFLTDVGDTPTLRREVATLRSMKAVHGYQLPTRTPAAEVLSGFASQAERMSSVLRTDIAARKLEPNSPRTGPTLGRVYLGLLSVCQDWDSAEHEVADLTWRTGVEAELKVLRDAIPALLGVDSRPAWIRANFALVSRRAELGLEKPSEVARWRRTAEDEGVSLTGGV